MRWPHLIANRGRFCKPRFLWPLVRLCFSSNKSHIFPHESGKCCSNKNTTLRQLKRILIDRMLCNHTAIMLLNHTLFVWKTESQAVAKVLIEERGDLLSESYSTIRRWLKTFAYRSTWYCDELTWSWNRPISSVIRKSRVILTTNKTWSYLCDDSADGCCKCRHQQSGGNLLQYR